MDERIEGGNNNNNDDDDDEGQGENNNDGNLKLPKKSSRSLIDDSTMKNYIDIIKNFKSNSKKTAEAYYLFNRYEVKNGYLYNKAKGTRMIPLGEVFDEIYKSHISTGHGGEKRTFHDLRFRGIANISMKHVGLFISTCKICLKKRINNPSTSTVIKPIISGNFGERGQVDLIDMSSFKTTQHRYIINYQDHFSKFCLLRPLINKDVASVVKELIDIFAIIGCPKLLQCDNGLEFRFDDELKKIWPSLKIIHGRPRHPQSQGSVERANQDIEQIMRCWLADNYTTNWVRGLPFIQMQKNNALNRTLGFSPFFAVFGKTMSLNDDDDDNNGSDDDNDDDEYPILELHSNVNIGLVKEGEMKEKFEQNNPEFIVLNIDSDGVVIKSNEEKEGKRICRKEYFDEDDMLDIDKLLLCNDKNMDLKKQHNNKIQNDQSANDNDGEAQKQRYLKESGNNYDKFNDCDSGSSCSSNSSSMKIKNLEKKCSENVKKKAKFDESNEKKDAQNNGNLYLNDNEIVDIDKAPLCNDSNTDKKQQRDENIIQNDQNIIGSVSGISSIMKIRNLGKKFSENVKKNQNLINQMKKKMYKIMTICV